MRREPDLALAGTFPGSMLSMYNVDSASDGAPTGSVYIVLEEHGGKHTAGVVLDEDAVAELCKALPAPYDHSGAASMEEIMRLRAELAETDRQRRVAEAKAEMLAQDSAEYRAQLKLMEESRDQWRDMYQQLRANPEVELDTDPTLEPEVEAVAQMVEDDWTDLGSTTHDPPLTRQNIAQYIASAIRARGKGTT